MRGRVARVGAERAFVSGGGVLEFAGHAQRNTELVPRHRAAGVHLRRRAQRTHGLRDARSGAVVIVQRFGAALNLNVYGHALVLDGVCASNPNCRAFSGPSRSSRSS